MGEISSHIVPEIENVMSTATSEFIINQFIDFQSEVDSLLAEIENFSKQIEQTMSQNIRHDDGSLSGSSIMRELKQSKDIVKWDEQMSNILRKGSLLISRIREFVTGETIKYQIGIMYYGNIYEFEVPETELLKYAKISYATKRTDISKLFTLKLGAKGYGKKSLINTWQQYQVSSGVGRFSTGQVFKSFLNHTGAKNMGNVYEATKKYQYQKGRKSQSEVFASIAGNIISSTKGGDFDNTQYKFFGRSAPTLADMSVIVNTLQACQQLFNLPLQQLGQGIKNIFVKDRSQIDSRVEINSLKEINKHIDELVKTLQIS